MICCKSIVYLAATTSARRAPGGISQYLPVLYVEEETRKKEREAEGGGWNYVLSFIFEGAQAQLWTPCSSTCRLFSASVLKVYRTSNSTHSLNRERDQRGNNMGRRGWRVKRFRVLELNARNEKEWKLRSRELERAHSLTRDCSVNDGLTHDVTG